MKKVAVIDYGAGNLRSVTKALEHIAEAGEVEISLCTSPDTLKEATHIILPGVGAFGDCMRGLQSLSGMIPALETQVLEQKIPFLGICVGMQMLLEEGHEHGRHSGLGWFKGNVQPLKPEDKTLKIPHMGWNNLQFNLSLYQPSSRNPLSSMSEANGKESEISGIQQETSGYQMAQLIHRITDADLLASGMTDAIHPLFTQIPPNSHAYFVHSYHCVMENPQEIIATTDYGGTLTAAIARENIHGVQFHPEKSQETGLRLFRNFLNMATASGI